MIEVTIILITEINVFGVWHHRQAILYVYGKILFWFNELMVCSRMSSDNGTLSYLVSKKLHTVEPR